MKIVSDSAMAQMGSEIAFIKKLIMEKDAGRKKIVTGNLIRSMNNEKRIAMLEDRSLRMVEMLAAMYVYMKGQKGFNGKRFMSILTVVASDKRLKRGVCSVAGACDPQSASWAVLVARLHRDLRWRLDDRGVARQAVVAMRLPYWSSAA